MDLLCAPIQGFVDALQAAGTRRAFVLSDAATRAVQASHAALQPFATAVATMPDFAGHEAAFFEIGEESGHLLSAFVHRSVRGQTAGGVRFWSYATLGDLVRDGLRLSRGMGQKCALAGLWWGGGKGVIARREAADHRDAAVRAAVYRDYGRFVSGLCGVYVTAEDVGTTPEDMARVFETTRFTTCIPPAFGGSGNPSILTARGVVVAMEAALDILGRGGLEGKTVAMQGLGNVAHHMVGELLERKVARIVAVDIDPEVVARAEQAFGGAPLEAHVVEARDSGILAEPCDVLAPNAVGATLNPHTIPFIQAPVVCGAANNQLEDSARDARALVARGILYVPDFLANRMGIVNCANEQYGVIGDDPAIAAHLSRDAPEGIFRRCIDVFERARVSGRTPVEEAEALADALSLEPHPVWGHRGRHIIDHLVASGWAD